MGWGKKILNMNRKKRADKRRELILCVEKFWKHKITIQTGGCCIFVHPKWGSKAYPSTFVTNATIEIVSHSIQMIK